VHLWFDRKLTQIDHLLFRDRLLSVYADMSNTCRSYNPDRSMLELVLAPALDWISKPDQEIVAATLVELENFFPITLGSEATVAEISRR